jgi:hypothetical protein
MPATRIGIALDETVTVRTCGDSRVFRDRRQGRAVGQSTRAGPIGPRCAHERRT